VNREKALNLVRTIISTHRNALGAGDERAAEALRNAEQDIRGLVEEIFDECEFKFDRHVDDAIDVANVDEGEKA
jgi:hypothetical protein